MTSVTTLLPRVMQDGRTVPTPEVHALVLELLDLQPGEKVLEVGSGSGTTAAELSRTGAEVHSIELEPVYGEVLDPQAEHVYFHRGDGKLGLEPEAPFDAIVATCGVERVPDTWQRQVREGGRVVCPLGTPRVQRLVKLVKKNGLLWLDTVRAYVRFSMMR